MTATSIIRPHSRPRASRRVGVFVVLAALAATAAGGCAPTVNVHGHRLDDEALARIVPGQTTRQQVAQLLGSPSAVGTFDGEAWYYIGQRTEHRSFYQNNLVAQDVVAITFDEQGTVASLDRHGLEQARDVALVGRETPTGGNELGLFEQLIGNVGRFESRASGDSMARP
jgi:outer membrane protein assembly factor BamE (lipoprotein component of BamABCDE complex)